MTMIVRKRGDWLAARVDNEILMMSAENGMYLGLSDVGARIWELIDDERDIAGLCTQLEREFDVSPEICRAEVAAFLDEMAHYRAVDLDPQPDA